MTTTSRPAAESRAVRNAFRQADAAVHAAPVGFLKLAHGAQHEVVFIDGQSGVIADQFELGSRGELQLILQIQTSHQQIDLVVAVGPFRENAQGEIDLGRCRVNAHEHNVHQFAERVNR